MKRQDRHDPDHLGQDGRDFDLAGQGLLEDAQEIAIKRVLAWQITEAQGLTKTAMAALMRTDRRQLDRLLDPNNPSVTLSTLRRAASAVGRKLRVELA